MAFSLSDFFETPSPGGGGTFFDPGGTISGGGIGGLGETGQQIADPLDIFGVRAGQTADEVRRLNKLAAQEAIDFQRGQLGQVTDLFDPFVQAGQQPLSELVAGVTGQGDFQFTPSAGFQGALEQGGRGVRRAAAARGLLDSSGTESRLSDLVNSLTGQEVQRQIEQRLQPIRTAQDASRIIGGQEAATAGAGSAIFGNLGAQNLATAQQLGQARQSAFQSAAGGLSGLSNLLAAQPSTASQTTTQLQLPSAIGGR